LKALFFFSGGKCEDKQLPRINCFLSSSCKTPPGKLIRICKTGQISARKGKEKEALKPTGSQRKVLAFIVPVNSRRSLEKVAQRIHGSVIHCFEGRFNIAQEATRPQHLRARDRSAGSRGGWTALQDHCLSQGTDLGFRHADVSKTKLHWQDHSLLHQAPSMAPRAGVHPAAVGNRGVW